jgi:hypothetical protein
MTALMLPLAWPLRAIELVEPGPIWLTVCADTSPGDPKIVSVSVDPMETAWSQFVCSCIYPSLHW